MILAWLSFAFRRRRSPLYPYTPMHLWCVAEGEGVILSSISEGEGVILSSISEGEGTNLSLGL